MSADGQRPALYGYWRSSSSYRVRIALNLKGIPYEYRAIHLIRDGGEHNAPEYRRKNPQGLVPALEHDGNVLTQSLAIMEYLDEVFPGAPLLPDSTFERARVRALAQAIACEMQPLNNLAVLQHLKSELSLDQDGVTGWYRHWVMRGFSAFEALLATSPDASDFCHGNTPGLADCCLVPQVYNAERFDCDLGPFPKVRRITDNCREMPPFVDAAPENQPDAPPE
jgi:maleylacetoacetate isomerase